MNGSRREGFAVQFVRLLARAMIAASILWLVVTLPVPIRLPLLFEIMRVPVAVFLFIAYIGKVLFDTFFYDRYPY